MESQISQGHGCWPVLHHLATPKTLQPMLTLGNLPSILFLATSRGSLDLPMRWVYLVHLIHIADPEIKWGAKVTRLRCSQPPGKHTKRTNYGLRQTCEQGSTEQGGGPRQTKPMDTYFSVTGQQAWIPACFQASCHWSGSGKYLVLPLKQAKMSEARIS